MNDQLQQTLYDKYPQLFTNKNKSIMESCMGWGIECGDGWYDIISSVCWVIAEHENNKNYRDDQTYYPIKFDQIKEKFGGLRIYYSGGDDYISGTIRMAEEMSYKICEVCGQKGQPNKNGWISTLCDIHRNPSK